MNDLVNRLSTGNHPVSVSRYESSTELEEAIARGFVLVRFTGTRGVTELGFKIDRQKSNVDLKDASGKIQLVGQLTLDYVPLECAVEIDVQTRGGTGSLRPLGKPASSSAPVPQQVEMKTPTKKKSKRSLQ